MTGLELAGVKVELRRLRQGQALAQPHVVLDLSEALRDHLAGGAAADRAEPELAVAVVAALHRAVDQLGGPDRLIARVELNLDARHCYPTLTERQESLAAELRCTAKTIRRRADKAITTLALFILAGRGVGPAPGPVTPRGGRGTADPDPDMGAGGDGVAGPDAALSRFWRLGPGSRVDVVCSEIPADELPDYALPGDRNYLRYAKFADLDTLIYVRTRLAQIAPAAAVRDFSPSEHHDTDAATMIVIGGPPWNAKYREFLPQLPYYFAPHPLGEDDPLVIPQLGDLRIGPHWTSRAELVEDVAVFTRLTMASGTTVFLLGGCLTLGVLGAAKAFLHGGLAAANTAWVADNVGDGDVVVVTEVRRVGGMTDVAELGASGPLLALRRTRPGQRFDVLVDNSARYPR